MRQADKRFAYRSSCICVLGSGAHAELLMEHLENESVDDDAGSFAANAIKVKTCGTK